ncbi:bromodomain-containing protein DDB_G0280777-like [Lineus longissimus]|uniref:bromodomain-containing protein DDB_G0280777-like n=1 Tax=Lineus longissimus TaxID=88925 RepID=UPI00315CFE17
MFVNQINSKDLFTTNPMKVYGGKEYSDSQGNSQMCSQLEFSNTNTNSSQECFSQQINVGFSQNESPQKKSYYQKFVSRGPLFTHGSKQQPSTSRITYKQDLDGNKARAKERDERDLLYTIVNTVSQCATEVKSAVELVKENSQNASASSDKRIIDFLQSLQTELDKRYEDIGNAVRKRDDSKQENQCLKEEIAAKNATICELREKVEKLEEDQDKKIVEALRDVYKEQQELNREQIHQYHEKQLKELSKQANLHKGYQTTLDSHAVQLKHNREKTQQQLCQLEADVSKELDTYQKEQQNRYSQITSDCQEQIKNLHREQRGELVDYFNKQMSKTNNLNGQRQQELQKQFREEIESLGKQQKVELVALIQQEVQLESKVQEDKSDKMLQQSLNKHQEEQEILVLELQHQKMQRQICAKEMEKQSQAYEDEIRQLKKENATKKELAEREQKKAKEMQEKELEILRRKHEQEFEVLRRKHQANDAIKHDGYMGCQTSQQLVPVSTNQVHSSSASQFSCPDIDPLGRCDSNTSDVKLNPRNAKSPFVSPSFRKTGWSSEALFRKGGPSPIATVYPQKASVPDCNSSKDDARAACSVDEVHKEDVAPADKGKKKGRRQKRGKAMSIKKSPKVPARRQPKRTACTPNLDQSGKQDSTPATVPYTRRQNASAPSSETLPPRKVKSPDWIQKKRKAITPSVEKLHPNPSTPSWLQAHRDARNREAHTTQSKETAVVECTPPIWKKQHCDDSLIIW